jgi:phosphohistidine phosphatase SixA
MSCRRRHLLALAAAAFLPRTTAAAADDPLLDRLRAGGLVLLMRHASTDPGTGDPPGFRPDDCATQRNLSEAGRAQARQIGARLRAGRVPVDRVLTSRWCRCRDTAELLELGPPEHFEPLDSFFDDPGQMARHRQGILRFIASWRGPGNAMLVTHQVNVTAVTEVFPTSGEIVCMSAGNEPEVLGRLRLWDGA